MNFYSNRRRDMQPVQNLLFSCGPKSLNQQGDLLQADFLLNHEGMLIIRVGAKLEAEMALSSVEQQIRHLMKQPRLSIVFSFKTSFQAACLSVLPLYRAGVQSSVDHSHPALINPEIPQPFMANLWFLHCFNPNFILSNTHFALKQQNPTEQQV